MTRFMPRALAAGLMLLGVPLAVAAPAAATPVDEPYVLVYQASGEQLNIGPEGEELINAEQSGEIFISCFPGESACTVTTGGVFPIYLDNLPIVLGGPNSSEFGDSASACNNGWTFGTLTVTAEATGFHAVADQPSPGWEDCEVEGRMYRHSTVVTITAGPPTGDLCLFEEGRCEPIAASEPEPPVVTERAGLASGDAAAPSVLAALPSPAQAGVTPGQLAITALVTVVLVLLVAFPTALLNSAVDTGVDRVSTWLRQRRAVQPPSGTGRSWTSTWWWAACGVAAAALISAFVDPQFGFNPGSARMLLSLLVGFALDVVLGWFLVIWLARRLIPEAKHSFSFKPITLLVVIAAVVFTRVTGFEPGIVFGLVAGVSFGALASKAQSARVVLLPLGFALLLGVMAWLAYGLIPATDSFWLTFLQETLASVAIGGMAALPIALVPLRGLAGHTIWQWNRWVWAGCYAVGLMAFFTVLMPMPFSWSEVSLDLVSWLVIYFAYALIAVVLWLVIAYARRSRAQPATPPE